MSDVPTCWRCRERPGVVFDGTSNTCIECAGETMRRTREMLRSIDDAVTTDLPILPKIADRVEFVRECVKMQREIGAGTLRPFVRRSIPTPESRR